MAFARVTLLANHVDFTQYQRADDSACGYRKNVSGHI